MTALPHLAAHAQPLLDDLPIHPSLQRVVVDRTRRIGSIAARPAGRDAADEKRRRRSR